MDNFIIDTEAFQITQGDFYIRALVATGIGAIIGLEREYAAINEKIKWFAGIRTFMFVTLLGFIGGMAYYLLNPLVYLGILFSVITITVVSYFITASKGDIGATTEFSALISFFLGTLTFHGFVEISLIITVLVVVMLSAKFKLHSIVGRITAEELYDFIRYIVIALLVFPFLPDKTYDPYNVINPREIGIVILLISGLGFFGYILMKFLGARKGILLSGFIGGLVSSTAVTWVFSKKSKENENQSHNCAIAIMAASSIMVIRVLVWAFIFNKDLFNELLFTLLLLFLAAAGVALFFYFKARKNEMTDADIRQGKPLDLQGALVFGFIYTVILLVVSYANENLGNRGLLVSSAIAGLSDLDAITITVSKLAKSMADMSIAGIAILIATISNTLVKLGISFWAGSKPLRKYLLPGYGIVFLSAVIGLLLLMVR